MLIVTLAATLLGTPVSSEIVLPSEPSALHGSMLAPDTPAVASALIIAGSGPTDRDGDSPLGVRGGVLRQLAEGLAEAGIATVRYDKRGIAASRNAGLDESSLRFDDLVRDAQNWAEETRARTGQPCVWLIGHSEGALIAQLAGADNPGVCGLILLSPVGRRAAEQIREQLEASLPEPLKAQALTALSELEAGRTTDSAPPALAALFRPSVQPYLISYINRDPLALASSWTGPMLLVHGSHDIQVPALNTEALKAAQPAAETLVVEGANHILRQAPVDRAANVATYSDASLPLDPAITEAVSGFILRPR
jgi:alpha-beta hydrolase superfamily lysophospholipase